MRTARRWAFAATAAMVALIAPSSACQRRMESRPLNEDNFPELREAMVRRQIEGRGVRDERVLAAMRRVPRHRFVPDDVRARSYDDTPLPIGLGQTISQPYIVAYMSEALALRGDEKVLEIGTGSGYQAAILAELCKEVYTIEIVAPLAERARETLTELGLKNVQVRTGDGYRGWKEQAPFDAIMVTAAPAEVPRPLLEQLKVGGRLVIPVGTNDQNLVRYTRTAEGLRKEMLLPVRFVPMTGEVDRQKGEER
jgi:protein-L-isoaspartate(D-aspartate) O-methyltransferase